jgi:hypothetical protein
MFSDSIGTATPIRFASTANLNIFSGDRYTNSNIPKSQNIQTAADFTITAQQNILAGFFTRFAVTEMVINWGLPNISTANDNYYLDVTVDNVTERVELDTGFYTVSSAMKEIVSQLNALYPSVATFAFEGNAGSKYLKCFTVGPIIVPKNFLIVQSNLADQLGFATNVEQEYDLIVSPYLMPDNYRYLDFVSPQLTYQQGLKDASTAKISRDILYRWNFGWDGPAQLDEDGYAIQQGYNAFVQRRYLSFPKQIRWTGTQPLGQLSFQVYDADGKIVVYNPNQYDFIWSMNLLISEN